MNRRLFAAMGVIISMLWMSFSACAENMTSPVYVDASEENKMFSVGNVTSDHFGVHIRAENGHKADVTAKNIAVNQLSEGQETAGLYVFADGKDSFANVRTDNLTLGEPFNNFGGYFHIQNSGRAVINTGTIKAWSAIDLTAEGNDSSVIVNAGDLEAIQYGLVLSINNAEAEVKAGNITAVMDGIFPMMVTNGGKARITAQNVISKNDIAISGNSSGEGTELILKTKDIDSETIGLNLSSTSGGRTFAEAENVIVFSSNASGYAYGRHSLSAMSNETASIMDINITGSVSLEEDGDGTDFNEPLSSAVIVSARDNSKSNVRIGKKITIKSEKTRADISGIRAENAGGKITISAGSDVSAAVSGETESVYGLYIINDISRENQPENPQWPSPERPALPPNEDFYSKSAGDFRTEVSIDGDLSSSSYGLYLVSSDSIYTDVLVTGTISGENAGVLVNENTTPENFELTVWNIESNSEGCVAVNTDGNCAEEVEAKIRYIINVTGSQNNYRLTDQYGNSLETPHGYPAAKMGDTVCLHTADSYDGTGLTDGNDGNCQIVSKGGAVSFTVDSVPAVDFFHILDREGQLPATGFSTHSASQLPLRPEGLVYGNTGLTLQIPSQDVMEPIVTVSKTDGVYPVEWLGSDIGLLEGTALPGEGISVLTGHNHLNTTEAGPFLFLNTLEENDLIMIADDEGNPRIFHVEGNFLISPDGLNTLADKLTEKTLLLVTCEDESVDGGYLHRRVISALPE